MNNYVKLAKYPYNKDNFKIENNHIQSINIVWCREDIIQQAENQGINLTDDEIDQVLYCLEHEHDATCGISWETIDVWIDEVIRERK